MAEENNTQYEYNEANLNYAGNERESTFETVSEEIKQLLRQGAPVPDIVDKALEVDAKTYAHQIPELVAQEALEGPGSLTGSDEKVKYYEDLFTRLQTQGFQLKGLMHFVASKASPAAESLMLLLNTVGVSYTEKNSAGKPPFYYTLEKPDLLPNLRFLVLIGGANINEVFSSEKGVPLAIAIRAGNLDAVKFLLRRDAKLNYIDLIGHNLVISAIVDSPPEKRYEMVKLLLKERRDIDGRFQVHWIRKTALMFAAETGDVKLVDLLLKDPRFDSTLKWQTRSNKTALSLALEKSSLFTSDPTAPNFDAVAKRFINAGLVLSREEEASLLQKIVDSDTVTSEMLQFAQSIGIHLNSYTDFGDTLLTAAIRAKKQELVAFLVKIPVLLTTPTSDGLTPVEVAVKSGNLAAVQLLFETDSSLSPDDPAAQMKFITLALEGGSDQVAELFEYLTYIFDIDLNAKDSRGMTPLMAAAAGGNEAVIQFLLGKGVDVNITQDLTGPDQQPKFKNAYDYSKDMKTRLLLAPYYETDRPRFKGFFKDSFDGFGIVFDDPSAFVICPLCFVTLEHGGGCMYIFEHNCLGTRSQLEALGVKSLPIVHEKLYHTYKDDHLYITVCIHCNRMGGTFTQEQFGPGADDRFVGHNHIKLNHANPYVQYAPAPRTGSYHDKTTCLHQGGGGPNEKLIRIQMLINFMCLMNATMIGKVSNHMAHLMAREAFWDAPLDAGDDQARIATEIRAQKKFTLPCELLEVREEEAEANEANYPNVPRYETNEIDLAPVEVTNNRDGHVCYYKTAVWLEENHPDERPLYGFKHRQPRVLTVFDHAQHDQYICSECLELFLVNTFGMDGSFTCFQDPECLGHFHPTEIQGKVSQAFYERYRKAYNRNPPVMRGGSLESEEEYPPLLGPAVKVNQHTCPIHGGFYRKRTRKYKAKKTRKAKQHRKTRRH